MPQTAASSTRAPLLALSDSEDSAPSEDGSIDSDQTYSELLIRIGQPERYHRKKVNVAHNNAWSDPPREEDITNQEYFLRLGNQLGLLLQSG